MVTPHNPSETIAPSALVQGLGTYAAAAGAIVIWGGTAVMTKLAVGGADPILIWLLRLAAGGLIALGLLLILRLPRPRGREAWTLTFLIAALQFIAWPGVIAFGLDLTSASHAALILASLPLFTGLWAALLARRRPRRPWWIGCALAFAGEVWLLQVSGAGAEPGSPDAWTVEGDLLLAAGCSICGLGYVLGARLSNTMPASAATFWSLFLAGAAMLPGFLFIPVAELEAVSSEAWIGVGYLAAGSSCAGYLLWYFALARGGAGKVGTVQFMQAPATLILAALILGETLSLALLPPAVAILGGVWLAQRS